MLHYANVIMLLYVYVCRQTCFVYICMCMHVYMYILRSIFMQADIHEYVGMNTCKSINARMCAYIVHVCMHVCIEANRYKSICIYMYLSMYVGRQA